MTLGACKISHRCNILQIPWKIILLEVTWQSDAFDTYPRVDRCQKRTMYTVKNEILKNEYVDILILKLVVLFQNCIKIVLILTIVSPRLKQVHPTHDTKPYVVGYLDTI